MKKSLLVLIAVCILIALPACGNKKSEYVSTQTKYHDDNELFTFIYPTGWTIEKNLDDYKVIVMAPKDGSMQYIPNLRVLEQDANLDLSSVTKESITNDYGSSVEGFEIYDLSSLIYNVHDCVTYTYSYIENDTRIYAADYLINVDKRSYKISYFVSVSDFNNFQLKLETIAQSFIFNL